MEKDRKNIESVDDDDENEEKASSSKSNKKSESKQPKKSENDRKPKDDSSEQPQEIASFFRSDKTKDSDTAEKNLEKNDDEDLEPGLTEIELHEATLAIVDARMNDIAEELDNAEPDSADEYEAVAGAIFLEELQEIADSEVELTEDMIELAFIESVDDLNIEDSEPTDLIDADQDNELPIDPTSISSNNISVSPYNQQNPPNPPNIGPNNPIYGGAVPNNNHSPTAAIPNQIVVNRVETVEIIHGRRSDMLVGAIIGYIVGRRGGRKRTEKKLQPKIDRLEEQVTKLHEIIINKEDKIRNLARKNVEISQNSKEKTADVIKRRKAKKEVKESILKREELSKDPKVEKLGKFSLPALKVFHEKRLPDGEENSPKRVQVEVMTESELLEKIAGLEISGLSVSEMYYQKRITLDTLRQITKEYLRSGPYKQTFSSELLPDHNVIKKYREKLESINGEINSTQNVDSDATMKNQNQSTEYGSNTDPGIKSSGMNNQSNNPKIQNTTKTWVVVSVVLGLIAFLFLIYIL